MPTPIDDVSLLYSPTGATSALGDMNTKLNNSYDLISKINSVQASAMNQQNKVLDVIQTETSRITDKKQTIDQAMDSHKRLMELNDNYRKRYLDYIKMAIAICIGLGGIWIVRIIDGYFNLGFIADILISILLVAMGVYCYLILRDLNMKNPLQYDELNISAPPTAFKNAKTADDEPSVSNDLLSGGDGCVGSQCCSTGTTWDSTSKTCIKVQGFVGENTLVKPYSPNECTEYSKVR